MNVKLVIAWVFAIIVFAIFGGIWLYESRFTCEG